MGTVSDNVSELGAHKHPQWDVQVERDLKEHQLRQGK